MNKSLVAFAVASSFMMAAPAVAQSTFAWDPQTTDTGADSDFDFAEQLFAPVTASNITFAGSGYFHDHGISTADFTLSLLIGGSYQVVFTGTDDLTLSSLGTINFAGGEITGLRLASTQGVFQAFHSFGTTDSFVLNGEVTAAVPEPASWAMMLLGFGAIGVSMRRRRREQAPMQVA